MDKIIFLDIDGVLNSSKTFANTKGYTKAYSDILESVNDVNLYIDLVLKERLLDIDKDKLSLLKQITDVTGAKIVISSSWRNIISYPLVEEYLVNYGLPIIGVTKKLGNRGEEINLYLFEHNIENYVIIDDEVFPDFTEEQKYNLIWTSFYQDGLNEECVNEAIRILGVKKFQQL